MAKAYVATVQLLIVADTLEEAYDAIGGILSDYEMAYGALKDWAYLKTVDSKGNEYFPDPVEVEIDEDYEEGDFLA